MADYSEPGISTGSVPGSVSGGGSGYPLTDTEQALADAIARLEKKPLVSGTKTQPVYKGLSIVSDGTPHGTHVFIDGKEMEHVRGVSWCIDNDTVARVTLDLCCVPVTVNATNPPEVTMTCPKCGDCGNLHTCEPTS